MSSFSSSIGRTFQTLGTLARQSGEGIAQQIQFEQDQVLLGNVLRQENAAIQKQESLQNQEFQKQKLRDEQDSRRFTQALQQEQSDREAEAQQQELTIEDRERQVALRLRERELERLENQLSVSERRVEVEEERAEIARIAASRPQDVNKTRASILNQVQDIDAIMGDFTSDLSDQDRVKLATSKEALMKQLSTIDGGVQDAAVAALRTAQIQQTQRPVNKSEAGPKLREVLNTTGQTEADAIPTDSTTGQPDRTKLRVGRVYFLPGNGPGVWTGKGFELISEIDDTTPPPRSSGSNDIPLGGTGILGL